MPVFDDRLCRLGEGPLWHPARRQLFWFDILEKAFLSRVGDTQFRWDFDEYVSACGWVDESRFLIASESALFSFNIETGERVDLCELEADNAVTRSNDGRADPFGGFWIGTMGKNSEAGAGAIYRYYRGALRKLFGDVTISNSICFSPDGEKACFTDTVTGRIMRVALDRDGWPTGEPEIYLDLRVEGLKPDGAVIDRDGNFWSAQWGSSRVAAYDRSGRFFRAVEFPASQISCPAFGGDDLSTLFATSAGVDTNPVIEPLAGAVFSAEVAFRGQKEHRVVL